MHALAAKVTNNIAKKMIVTVCMITHPINKLKKCVSGLQKPLPFAGWYLSVKLGFLPNAIPIFRQQLISTTSAETLAIKKECICNPNISMVLVLYRICNQR